MYLREYLLVSRAMSDKTIAVRLPAELLPFIDSIRFSQAHRVGRQWVTRPVSHGEVIEACVWEAQARAARKEKAS